MLQSVEKALGAKLVLCKSSLGASISVPSLGGSLGGVGFKVHGIGACTNSASLT